MGRLIGALASLVGWSCFATVLALAIVVGYGWSKGYLSPEKFETMAAIAHGVDMMPRREAEKLIAQKATAEKPSLEAVELQRAAMTSDLEMRENIVRDVLAEFKKLQRSLEEEKDRFDTYASAYEKRLQDEKAKAINEGQRQFQSIVESMKPKQAKEQLLLKYKENKIEVVVETMRNMDDAKRAKILTEFKASEDQEILAKILEQIRSPVVNTQDETIKALQSPTTGQ